MVSKFPQKILRKIRNKGRDYFYKFSLYRLSEKNRSSFIVLYHGIDLSGCTRFNYRFCSIKDFEAQIRFLKKHFDVVPLEELFTDTPSHNKIAITFDDGYLNNYKYALPILSKYKAPTTFFITSICDSGQDILWTDYIDIATELTNKNITIRGENFYKKSEDRRYYSKDRSLSLKTIIKQGNYDYKIDAMKAFENVIKNFKTDSNLFDYWKLLSKEDIQQLSNSKGITIGSHSYLHNNLANIPITDACSELRHSKLYLENAIQKNVNSLAFPDGSYNKEVVHNAETLGFKFQLACDYLFAEDATDKRIKNRIGIYTDIPWTTQIHNILV